MSPFGYNPFFQRWTCPFCSKIFYFKLDFAGKQFREAMIKKHSEEHSLKDPQQTLYGTKRDYYREVKDRMKIPSTVLESGATKSGLQFLKAGQIEGVQPGSTIDFTIQGDVETSGGVQQQDGSKSQVLYSVPVSGVFRNAKLQGQYSLNKTALKILVTKLGDETEAWIGAKYTAFVGPTRNPRTQLQTLGFSILADTVKSAKSR